MVIWAPSHSATPRREYFKILEQRNGQSAVYYQIVRGTTYNRTFFWGDKKWSEGVSCVGRFDAYVFYNLSGVFL